VVVYGLKPAFRRALAPTLRMASRFQPNTISALAILFAAGAGACLAFADRWPALLLLTPPLVFLRIACNALDGMVAQARGMATRQGELVNEFSDRVNDALVFGGLALSSLVEPSLALGALAVAFAVSYLGILPKAAGGSRVYTGPFGKADRMLLLGLACVLAYVLPLATPWKASEVLAWALWAGIALGALTVGLRWRLAWRQLRGPP
jgi:CDP-diacylglycerol---glycerol-3-phosphate 3-phosphatidyltransferase